MKAQTPIDEHQMALVQTLVHNYHFNIDLNWVITLHLVQIADLINCLNCFTLALGLLRLLQHHLDLLPGNRCYQLFDQKQTNSMIKDYDQEELVHHLMLGLPLRILKNYQAPISVMKASKHGSNFQDPLNAPLTHKVMDVFIRKKQKNQNENPYYHPLVLINSFIIFPKQGSKHLALQSS